ncbi:MAG: tetratricopeptide repeat protein [Bdellovibrionales bacterium]|nr:tetratricopeptide repeat protein [Bdellovibrionales bacterium]
MRYSKIKIMLLMLLFPITSIAQHPVEIQKKTAEGDHYRALVDFEKLPKRRRTVDARLAAAKSAWALGLVDRAAKEYDSLLRENQLSGDEVAKILISRGIIELQENRPEVAIVYADKAVKKLAQASPLRSRAWMLWGEALYDSKAYGSACQKYTKALDEALPPEKPEIEFSIGKCERQLGKYKEAINHFQRIPIYHQKTPEAVKNLAHVSLELKEYDQAAFWLAKGKQEFPSSFLDSWVDYALMQIAIHQNDSEQVKNLREQAKEKYPPSDAWFALLEAAAEAYEWAEEVEKVAKNDK